MHATFKKTFLFSCAVSLLGAFSASADEGLYLQGGAQYVFTQDTDIETTGGPIVKGMDFDDGYGFTGALGYAAPSGFRSELELGYRKNDAVAMAGTVNAQNTSVRNITAMLNAYYDVNTNTAFKPYIGAGIGYSNATASGIAFNESGFAYQALAGLGYELVGGQTVYAGYRYFDMFDEPSSATNPNGPVEFDYQAHIAEVGFRVPLSPKPRVGSPEAVAMAAANAPLPNVNFNYQSQPLSPVVPVRSVPSRWQNVQNVPAEGGFMAPGGAPLSAPVPAPQAGDYQPPMPQATAPVNPEAYYQEAPAAAQWQAPQQQQWQQPQAQYQAPQAPQAPIAPYGGYTVQ